MKGTIYHTKKPRGIYSIKVDNVFIVIEDTDGADLNYGDIISGIPNNTGDATLKNLETLEVFSAIVQNLNLNEQMPYKRMKLIG
ncbi:MAG: hypothetical protein Q8L07_01530 [Sediminibacterium sp.]|nr:hypothetical protein [Sediminibacterium sp.]